MNSSALSKKALRIVFWVCWIFIGLAATVMMMPSNRSVLPVLVFALALTNILAASENDNVVTEGLRKVAIAGNVSILVYGLTSLNIANYSIFLLMVFALTIYLFSPRLFRQAQN